jgi:hypothetical protein
VGPSPPKPPERDHRWSLAVMISPPLRPPEQRTRAVAAPGQRPPVRRRGREERREKPEASAALAPGRAASRKPQGHRPPEYTFFENKARRGKVVGHRFYFLFYCGFCECERMSMVARRVPGSPQKMCVYSHPAHPAMEMQDTFHCFLGASSSGYTTHKVLKRMLPLGVPNRSTKG